MPYILDKIAALELPARKYFLETVLEDQNLNKAFCKHLSAATEADREAFYKSLPTDRAATFRECLQGDLSLTPAIEKKALTAISRRLDTLAAELIELEKRGTRARQQAVKLREALKSGFAFNHGLSDQSKGAPRLPAQKPYPDGCEIIDLPKPDRSVIKKSDILTCIADRVSRRRFSAEPLSLPELSYLLWATQGVRKMRPPSVTFRTVPSAGAMHPLETYLAVHNVTGLSTGVYSYKPAEHKLVKLFTEDGLSRKVAEAALGQECAGNCAVTFIWSAVPYRTEWRYTKEAAKLILQDSGHLCQNLYLACESINCGTCAISAYSQKLFDKLCRLDGKDEFTLYVAPVGRVA